MNLGCKDRRQIWEEPGDELRLRERDNSRRRCEFSSSRATPPGELRGDTSFDLAAFLADGRDLLRK